MNKYVEDFFVHAIENMQGALEKQDSKLAQAVLINLSDVIDSYIEALEMSDHSATMAGQE